VTIFFIIENIVLNHFIHFQLQNNAPICLQIPKGNLGKIMLFSSCCSEIPDATFLFFYFFPSSQPWEMCPTPRYPTKLIGVT
jgi:hypothetical protein